jgi:hypothetical protein
VGDGVLAGFGSGLGCVGCSKLASSVGSSTMSVLWLGGCRWFWLSGIEGRFALRRFAVTSSLSSFLPVGSVLLAKVTGGSGSMVKAAGGARSNQIVLGVDDGACSTLTAGAITAG